MASTTEYIRGIEAQRDDYLQVLTDTVQAVRKILAPVAHEILGRIEADFLKDEDANPDYHIELTLTLGECRELVMAYEALAPKDRRNAPKAPPSLRIVT